MPGSISGGTKVPELGGNVITEPLGLDSGIDGGTLEDSDFSTLSLQHSSSQYTNPDLDALDGFHTELELDSIHAVDGDLGDEYGADDVVVMSEETVECVEVDGTVDHEEYLYDETEPESILPDMEDDGVDLENMRLSPSGILRPFEEEAEAAPPSPPPAATSQPIILIQSPPSNVSSPGVTRLSVSGGPMIRKISGGSAVTTMQQNQSQLLVTSKNSGSNIVQFRSATAPRPIMASGVATNLQGIKPLQSTLKRIAVSAPGPPRNVYAKVVVSGGKPGTQTTQRILSAAQPGENSGQQLKMLSSGKQVLGGTTRAITLAQAQQMGLISASSLQQILPSANKQPGKLVVQSTGVKSPTKILPAPSGVVRPALKPLTSPSGAGTAVLSPQKVVLRQAGLKPGTVISSSGQVLRLPASHNLIGTGGNVAQVQIPGTRQIQYVRLVSAGGSSSSNVATVTRPRMVSVASLPGGVRPVPIASIRGATASSHVKVVPIAPAAARLNAPKAMQVGQSGQRLLIPGTAAPARTVAASGMQGILPPGSRSIAYVVPAQLVQQLQGSSTPTAATLASSPAVSGTQAAGAPTPSPPEAAAGAQPRSGQGARVPIVVDTNGLRTRKPCNCTKSQCLKLYCDCFANGEFCYMCNCNNCFNNLQHEEDRQTAIKSCLERNTNAFRPKIGKGHVGDERRHNKGCNCKRSGCLKNYCECYEAKISCSNNCKCVGCRNVEEPTERNSLRDLADAAESRDKLHQLMTRRDTTSPSFDKSARLSAKPQFNFVTDAIVSATVECLAAIAEEAEANDLSDEDAERLLLEEFGRCLTQVISVSDKADESDRGIPSTPQATT